MFVRIQNEEVGDESHFHCRFHFTFRSVHQTFSMTVGWHSCKHYKMTSKATGKIGALWFILNFCCWNLSVSCLEQLSTIVSRYLGKPNCWSLKSVRNLISCHNVERSRTTFTEVPRMPSVDHLTSAVSWNKEIFLFLVLDRISVTLGLIQDRSPYL